MFACVTPSCGFSANADEVAVANQLRNFLNSDKGVALLASGYRASVNSLQSGRSGGLRNEAGTHRRGSTMCLTSVGNPLVHEGEDVNATSMLRAHFLSPCFRLRPSCVLFHRWHNGSLYC